jgi:hypothetical protein
MRLTPALEFEKLRKDPESWNKIFLHKDGKFFRAYEWSAWLIVAITYSDKVRHQQQGDRKPLKVSKKALASGGSDFCFVGFPIKSLEKFVPERTDFTSTEEKHIVVTIQLPQPTDGTEVTYERLHEAFQKWRDGILLSAKPDDIDADGNKLPPAKKPAKTAPTAAAQQQPAAQQPQGGILSQLLAYRLEMHTDNDNRQFIASLQHQIASIL